MKIDDRYRTGEHRVLYCYTKQGIRRVNAELTLDPHVVLVDGEACRIWFSTKLDAMRGIRAMFRRRRIAAQRRVASLRMREQLLMRLLDQAVYAEVEQ